MGLEPGDHLGAEASLLERYGVARASLREALRLLEAQGAVNIRRGAGGGALVASPEPAQLAGFLAMTLQMGKGSLLTILETRSVIEPTMAALAARRRTQEQLDQLKECTDGLLQYRSDSVVFHRLNRQFHDLVAQASGNLLLASLVPALSWMTEALGLELNTRVRKRLAIDKQGIVDAIAEGDSWRASELMSRMIMGFGQLNESDPEMLNKVVVWADVDELLEQHLSSE
ncbi:MAG: HTH-type transcriptional regulator LutR [Nitrospira sp.]|nr:HTH-type transcriptional regulator LutR [Nitrospira sp.]